MATGQQPQSYVPAGPTGAEIGRQLMAQFAQRPNSLAAILSGINQITRPTMGLPQAQSSPVAAVLMNTPAANAAGNAPQVSGGPSHAPAASMVAGAGAPAGSSASPGLSASSVGSLLSDAGKLYQTLAGSVPTGMAGTALGGAGLPTGLTAAQQADLSAAFTGAPVTGSLASAMGLTAGSLAPLAASDLAPIGTGAVDAAANAAGADAASELSAAGYGSGVGAGTAGASDAGAATSGALGAGAGAAAALGATAIPLALAAFVPYNAGFSRSQVQGLLNHIQAATKANGGLLNAGSGISNGQVSNPQLATGFQDLTTLLGTSPEEFSKAGGTGPIDKQLAAMGYGSLFGGPSTPQITAPLGPKNSWMGNGDFGSFAGRPVRK